MFEGYGNKVCRKKSTFELKSAVFFELPFPIWRWNSSLEFFTLTFNIFVKIKSTLSDVSLIKSYLSFLKIIIISFDFFKQIQKSLLLGC